MTSSRTDGLRGRVLVIDGATAVIRGERADVRIPASPDWKPGDLVDVSDRRAKASPGSAGARSDAERRAGWIDVTRVRAYEGPPYPGPATEVARLSRDRMIALRQRAAALAAVRSFFADRDFTEVETPLLVPSPGLEIHLDAVRAGSGYLITSPEYQMKRLLAAGFERIFQVCKCFRGNERGPHHSGEFTMIEWYRAFDALDSIIEDTEQLVAHVVTALTGDSRITARAREDEARSWTVDVTPPWRRMTVREAMAAWAKVDVAGDEPAGELVAKLRAAGIEVADDTAWDDAFFAAFLARVEPKIAQLDHPLILCDWPAPLAALARKRPDDPRVALRFEAYCCGLELANAFDELVDPVEQRMRFEDDLRIRRARGRAEYPIDDRLLAALAEGLPPSAGIALGFDRLVMLATGAPSIDHVLTFTADEL